MTGPGSSRLSRNTTADRTLALLAMFDQERLQIDAASVCAELGVGRSTAYRYLQSLVEAGFLKESAAGFAIGPRVLELARLARSGSGLSEVAVPIMRRLRDALGETVLLTQRVGDRVVCLEREETLSRVRITYDRGTTLPLHAGAAAQVLLAWLAADEARALLAARPLTRFTDRTITDVETLVNRLGSIRKRGIAVSVGELDPHVGGIAAPVFDLDGDVVCAISIAALDARLSGARLRDGVDGVRRAAAELHEAVRRNA